MGSYRRTAMEIKGDCMHGQVRRTDGGWLVKRNLTKEERMEWDTGTKRKERKEIQRKKNIYIYNFYLVIEVPEHVYVLVISSSISDCCISVFRFSWCCLAYSDFLPPSAFRAYTCIRSACQGYRFENVPHYLCRVIRHTCIKIRCSDVAISHFSPSYEIFPANGLRLRHIHIKKNSHWESSICITRGNQLTRIQWRGANWGGQGLTWGWGEEGTEAVKGWTRQHRHESEEQLDQVCMTSSSHLKFLGAKV